jgi:hypothetical protein
MLTVGAPASFVANPGLATSFRQQTVSESLGHTLRQTLRHVTGCFEITSSSATDKSWESLRPVNRLNICLKFVLTFVLKTNFKTITEIVRHEIVRQFGDEPVGTHSKIIYSLTVMLAGKVYYISLITPVTPIVSSPHTCLRHFTRTCMQ